MNEVSKYMGRTAAGLPLIFVGVASYLQVTQQNNDPVYQFMSELAIGDAGWFMLIAFLAPGATRAALGVWFLLSGASPVLVVLLLIAAS